MWWRDLTVSRKLAIGFGGMIVLMFGASTAGCRGLEMVGRSLEIVADTATCGTGNQAAAE